MNVYEVGDVIESFFLSDDFYHIPIYDTYVMDEDYIEYRVVENSYDDIRLMEDFENEFNREFRGEWELSVTGDEQRMVIAAQSYR